jgi:HK97 gp10 family phage protein
MALLGQEKLIAQLLKLSQIDTSEALLKAANALKDEVYLNWQQIDDDAPESDVIVVPVSPTEVWVNMDESFNTAFVEFGTIFQEAQPFFRPAIETIKNDMQEAMVEGINIQLRKI